MTEAVKFCYLNKTETCPPRSVIPSPLFCFQWFPKLPKLDCSETQSVHKASIPFRDLLVSSSWVLGLKSCTTTPSPKLFFNYFSEFESLAGLDLPLRFPLILFHLTPRLFFSLLTSLNSGFHSTILPFLCPFSPRSVHFVVFLLRFLLIIIDLYKSKHQ